MKIDLLAAESYAHGHPIDQLMYLQENDPVYRHAEPDGGPGYWALTRYKDIKFVHGNAKLFSNWPSDTVPDGTSIGDNEEHFHLIMSDPPHHTQHRRFLSQELLPKTVAGMQDHVQFVVDSIIDEVIEIGECDLVTDVAGKLSAYVTADLMGLSRTDMVEMYHIADRLVNAADLTSGDGLAAALELDDYTRTVWDDRHANPRDDLSTRYAHGEYAGRAVDYEQFSYDFSLLFNAAGDTTRNALGGGLNTLFQFPEHLAELRGNLDLARSAVEELLRYVTPLTYQRRTATADTVINGQDIAKGDKIASFFAAANRDPRVFPDPHALKLDRSPNSHLAFGFGPHFCLGAHLARLELRLMLQSLMIRMPDLEPVGSVEYHVGAQPIIVGPYSVPARFTPGERLLTAKHEPSRV